MMTRMPAAMQSAIASRTPSRTGSSKASRPANRNPPWGSTSIGAAAGMSRRAQPMTLCPDLANTSTRASQSARSGADKSQVASTVSGAPLVKAVGSLAAMRQMTVSRRRASVNGKSDSRVASGSGAPPPHAMPGRADRRCRAAPRRWRPATPRPRPAVRGGHLMGQHQRAGGDRPGLVGHDAGDAADVLHRDRTPNEGLLAGEAEDADAEEERVDDRELLGQRGHGQRDGTQERIDPPVAVPEPDGGERDAHDDRHSEQHGDEFADGLLQRGRGVAALGGRADDLAVARLAADADDAQPGRTGQQAACPRCPSVPRTRGQAMAQQARGFAWPPATTRRSTSIRRPEDRCRTPAGHLPGSTRPASSRPGRQEPTLATGCPATVRRAAPVPSWPNGSPARRRRRSCVGAGTRPCRAGALSRRATSVIR